MIGSKLSEKINILMTINIIEINKAVPQQLLKTQAFVEEYMFRPNGL